MTSRPFLPPLPPPERPGRHRAEFDPQANGESDAFDDLVVGPLHKKRLLVLKLDHHGDFIIGLPALLQLREIFIDDHITLICGSWNLRNAEDLDLADEIRTYDYFPENVQNHDPAEIEDADRFREICKGRFDIAIDLRVDDDTRPLLRHVDAALRCGIGSRSRFDFLNIALPFSPRDPQPIAADVLLFEPSVFRSRMPTETSFYHETDFSVTDTHIIYGPYCRLPLGALRAEFGLQLSAPILSSRRGIEIVVEVTQSGSADIIAFERIKRLPPRGGDLTVAIEFANNDPLALYEFRIFIGGRPRSTRLRFFGVRVEVVEKAQPRARFLPSELHIGEQLSLLVRLVTERVRPLYRPDLLDRLAGRAADALGAIPQSARCVVVAPISNSTVRDWPLERYMTLIGLLMARLECRVVLVGAAGQRSRLSHICQHYGGDRRLVNLGGQTDWAGLAAVLRRADLVIANNSGVAHLAAACGRPTLAIYSGSHQPQEWGPRGDSVRAVTAAVSCSPCGYESLELCPHDHLCMKLVEPELVLEHAVEMLAKDESRALPPDRRAASPPSLQSGQP